MKKRVVLLGSILSLTILNGQEIMVDRNGEPTVLYYEAASTEISLASADAALQATYTFPFKSSFYYIDNNRDKLFSGSDVKTVSKSQGLSTTFKLFSTTDYFFLSDISHYKPAFKVEIGYQNTVDTVHDLDAIPRLAKSLGIQVFAQMDNTSLYDSINLKEGEIKPWTFGLAAHLTLIKKNWCLPAFNASLTNSWNKDALLQYQYFKPSYINSQVVALDDFIGYIGNVERQWSGRFCFASPLFTNSDQYALARLSLAPYYVLSVTQHSTPKHIFGFSLNFFGDAISGEDFNYGDAFGIGCDWEQSSGKTSGPQIFLYGTLSIGDILDQTPVAITPE